jgi:methylated-DNA-[protein]-cysteine S-methyltransferase
MWTMTDSPVGPVRIISDGSAVTAIEFLGPRPVSASKHSSVNRAAELSADRRVGERADDDPLLAEAVRQLTAYFARELKEFDLPLAPYGTAFQQRVWEQLRQIGYGETVSYGELARRLGMTAAASRAVGAANGRNPIAIVIPCHRVVGAKGSLSGYAGGVERKMRLLDLEQQSLF